MPKAKRLPTRREILERYGLEHEIGPAETPTGRKARRRAELERLMRPRQKRARRLERTLGIPPKDCSTLIEWEEHIVDLEHKFRVVFDRQPGW